MMRIVTAAWLAALVGLLLPEAAALAQTAPSGVRTAQAVVDRYVGTTASPRHPARAGLSARAVATGRLPPLQSRPQCGTRMHRDLCAGIPAERHRDHAAHELLLAARLVMKRWIGAAIVTGSSSLGRWQSDRDSFRGLETDDANVGRTSPHRLQRAAYHRRYDRHGYRPQPHYYARPYYYRPYPYSVPAPFTFGFAFGPGWW